MRPAPDPAMALRAVPRAAPVPGIARPALSARPLPPSPAKRTLRVLAAGLGLSALGHAALALWLAQTAALPPPDGPEVPATEVSLLSGTQFAALTAPPPKQPEVTPPTLQPPPDDAAPMALPTELAPAPRTAPPGAMAAPLPQTAPDLAALTATPPDPQVALLLPELASPQPSPTGVAAPRPAPATVAQPAPKQPMAPARADAAPAAPEAAPAPPKRVAKPSVAAAPKAARKPASQAGDGGTGETTQAKSAGSADARDGWLSAIRARVERRKAYPAAAGGAEGRVTLQLTVDRAGRLKAVGVARSSGHALLDAAALRAVKAAGRFPKAPGAVTETAVTFNLPLRFSAGS